MPKPRLNFGDSKIRHDCVQVLTSPANYICRVKYRTIQSQRRATRVRRSELIMKDATTCLLLLVTVVHVLSSPIGTCSNGGSTASTNVLLADNNNCSVYYSCQYGDIVQYSCPTELHFNSVSQTCESPTSAGCQPSTLQPDLPTDPNPEAHTEPIQGSTTAVPTEQTTGDFTTECTVTDDGVHISTEYSLEGTTESVDTGGTTILTNEGTVYITTDLTIEISTADSPTAAETDSIITATDPDIATDTATTAQLPTEGPIPANQPAAPSDSAAQSAPLATGLPGSELAAASVPAATNATTQLGTESPVVPASDASAPGLANQPVAPSDSAAQSAPLATGQPGSELATASVPAAINATTQLGTESAVVPASDASAPGLANQPVVPSDSASQSAILPTGQPGSELSAALIPAATDATYQLGTGSAAAPASDVSVPGLANQPATSSDSAAQSEALPSGQPGSDLSAVPVPATTDASSQLGTESAVAPTSDISEPGLSNQPAAPSDPSTQSATALPTGQSGSDSSATSSNITSVPGATAGTTQLGTRFAAAPVSGAIAPSLTSQLAEPSDSPVQSAALPTDQSVSDLSAAPVPAASSDASAPGLSNQPAAPSDPSAQSAAAFPTGQSGSDLSATSSNIAPVPAATDGITQLGTGYAAAPVSDAIEPGLASQPAEPSDSPAQSVALPTGQSGSDLSSAPVPAASDAASQLGTGFAAAPTSDALAPGLSNQLAAPSNLYGQSVAAFPTGQSGSDVSATSSNIAPVPAATDRTTQLGTGSAAAPVSDSIEPGLASQPAEPSDSPAQSVALPTDQYGSDLFAAQVPAASDVITQLVTGSAAAPASDGSASILVNQPAATSGSPAHSAALPAGQPGSDLSATSSNIASVPGAIDTASQLGTGSAAAPASDPSTSGFASQPASLSHSLVQSAALPASQFVNYVAAASSNIVPVPAALDATSQVGTGSAAAPANYVFASGLATQPAAPSDPSAQSGALYTGQPGSDSSAATSNIAAVPAAPDASQLGTGSAAAPVSDVSTLDLVNQPEAPSVSLVQSAALPTVQLGSDLSAASSNMSPVPASSDVTPQLGTGSALASGFDVSAFSLSNLPVLVNSRPGIDVLSGISGISQNPAVLDSTVQLGTGSASSPVSSDILSKLPVLPFAGYSVLSAARPPVQPESVVTSGSSASISKIAVLNTVAHPANGYPVASGNDAYSAGIPKASLQEQQGLNVYTAAGLPADKFGLPLPIPFRWPYYYGNDATVLPDKYSLDPTSKLSYKNYIHNIKSELKQKIISDIKQFKENISSLHDKQVTSPDDVITTKIYIEHQKKLAKEFISNLTKTLKQLPTKSNELRLSLPQLPSKVYKKLAKEFVHNVTVVLLGNPDISSLSTPKFSTDELVKEFIANVTVIHDKLTTPKVSRTTTVPTTRRRKHQPKLSDKLDDDSASESEESKQLKQSSTVPTTRRSKHQRKLSDKLDDDSASESEESKQSKQRSKGVTTTKKPRRPTTVPARFEWIADKYRNKEEKQSKNRRHSRRNSSEEKEKDSDED